MESSISPLYYRTFQVIYLTYTYFSGLPFDIQIRQGQKTHLIETCYSITVTPTDRPKSVCNRCVIDVFGRFCVVILLVGFFCGCRGYWHRTRSDIFLFLLQLFKICSILIHINACTSLRTEFHSRIAYGTTI